ncbi:hydantoinase/oxoprolinase N-terminal domain-containing protein, partial [Streptosporangium sp. NPDC001682]
MILDVGIDVGGTFTDAVAIADGRAVRGKAFSTPDVTTGILAALSILREQVGLSEAEPRTRAATAGASSSLASSRRSA